MARHLVDRMLEHYQILSLVDNGSLGPVYRARDTRLELEVALQILEQPVKNPDGLASAAQQAAALSHPGLVTLRDYGQVDRMVYLVTEWLAGLNLQAVSNNLALRPDLAGLPARAALVGQISRTVYYLHRQGIYQRDLRPNNFIVLENGRYPAVLTDIGLLSLDYSRLESQLARLDDGPERLVYLAPEIVTGQPPDERSDIYSLGRLLLTLLQGPVEFASLAEAQQEHRPNLEDLRSTWPALATVIGKAMARDPAGRYASARELAQALAAAAADPGQAAAVLPPAAPTAAPAPAEHPPIHSSTGAEKSTALFADDETATPGEMAAGSAPASDPADRLAVEMRLDLLHQKISPGHKTAAFRIEVTNTGAQPVQAGVAVDGIPAKWLSTEPPAKTIAPGQTDYFNLYLKPEADPNTRAGEYRLLVKAVDQTRQLTLAKTSTTIEVTTFSRFESKLWPENIAAGKPVWVIVENRGNSRQSYQVAYEDLSDRLAVPQATARLADVAPGQSASATFQPRLLRRPVWSREDYHFSIQVVPLSGQNQDQPAAGKSQHLMGVAAGRPLLTAGRLTALALSLLVVLGGAGLAYRFMATEQAGPAAQTAVAQATAGQASGAGQQPSASTAPAGDSNGAAPQEQGTPEPDNGSPSPVPGQTTAASPAPGQSPTNQPPAGRITNPSTASQFDYGDLVTIEVAASDPEARIRKVEFYVDDGFLNEDTASPYRYDWQADRSGTLELSARIIDDQGAAVETGGVNITVQESPSSTPRPVVSFSLPPAGEFNQGQTFNITVHAKNSADTRKIDSFRLFVSEAGDFNRFTEVSPVQRSVVDGVTILTKNNFSLREVGRYTLKAEALDNQGSTGEARVQITIKNVPPTVEANPDHDNPKSLYPWQTAKINVEAHEDFDEISAVKLFKGETDLERNCVGFTQHAMEVKCTFPIYDKDLDSSEVTTFKVRVKDSFGHTDKEVQVPIAPATPEVKLVIDQDTYVVGETITVSVSASPTPRSPLTIEGCPNNSPVNGCQIILDSPGSITIKAVAKYHKRPYVEDEVHYQVTAKSTITVITVTPTPTPSPSPTTEPTDEPPDAGIPPQPPSPPQVPVQPEDPSDSN